MHYVEKISKKNNLLFTREKFGESARVRRYVFSYEREKRKRAFQFKFSSPAYRSFIGKSSSMCRESILFLQRASEGVTNHC